MRNLIRRFVEVGVPGYHIEDQRPGTKKCGHQGGKVLVAVGRADQAPERGALPARRHGGRRASSSPAPTPRRPTCSTAAATSATSRSSSAPPTSTCPTYKACFLALMKRFHDLGVDGAQRPPALRALRRRSTRAADAWLERSGLADARRRGRRGAQAEPASSRSTPSSTRSLRSCVDAWEAEAGLETYGEAVAEVLEFRAERGRAARDERRGVARASRARASLYAAQGEGAGRSASTSSGTASTPRRRRATTRSAAASTYAIAKSLAAAPFADILWMETTTADLRRGARVRRGDPRRVPRQDARLQPVAVVQLGLDRDERRRDAALPRGARQDGLRLQLHHLRRPPDRRRRGRGVRDRAASRTACSRSRGCSARSAWSSRPTARRRRWSAARALDAALARLVGAHGDHQGDGQGLDPAPAPDPDRGAEEAARGVAGALERALPAARARCASSCSRTAPAPSCSSWRSSATGERQARQRRLRPDPRPPRPQHPLGARPEHLRRGAAQEAADDADPPLPGAPLQGRLGALRHADRGQPVPDREDEGARHLHARSTPRSARSSSPTSTRRASPSCWPPTGSRWAS